MEQNEKYLYHHTKISNLESILSNGLEIQNGENSKIVDDKKHKIFFSEGMEGAIAMAESFQYKFDGLKLIGAIPKNVTLENFLGESVFLRFSANGIKNENNKGDFAYADGWTSYGIPAKDLKVCILKNKRTNEILYHRDDILKYMLSTIPPEDVYKGDDEGRKEEIQRYYKKRSEELAEFDVSEYSFEDIGLDKFFEQFISKRTNNNSTNLSQKKTTIIDIDDQER